MTHYLLFFFVWLLIFSAWSYTELRMVEILSSCKGCAVINWRTTDLQQLDRQTKKLLSMHGVHHPAADVDQLYALCTEDGRGLQQIESTYQSCIVGLDCYLRAADLFMQMVQKCDARSCDPLIRSDAWLVSLLHSCEGVWLGTRSRSACMEVGPSCVMVSSSKRLKRKQTFSHVQQFFSYASWGRKLYSIAVSLRNHPW